MKPDNAEASFKCKRCGYTFSRGSRNEKKCPSCGFTCKIGICETLDASNEGY